MRRDPSKFCAEFWLPDVAPNELRHTAASLMLDAGMTMEEVAKVLGHRTTRILERHYSHQVRPVIDEHIAVMERILLGAR